MRLASAFPERAPTPAKVRDLDPTNDLTFLRVRSKKHEIIVAPERDYLLIVIQNNDGHK